MATQGEEQKTTGGIPVQPEIQPVIPPPNVGIGIAFQSGPLPPQLLEKISSEHITQVLSLQDGQLKRQHEFAIRQIDARERDREGQRKRISRSERNLLIFGGVTLVFILIISFLCFYYQQADIVKVIVPAILTGAAGFVAGRGYERTRIPE